MANGPRKILFPLHTSHLNCCYRGMKQHNSPFASPPILPSIITKYVEESSLNSMEAGEITSAIPWSIRWYELHELHTSLETHERFCEHDGICTALIIMDEENFVIDLTYISKSDMISLDGTHSCSCDRLEQLELRENFYRYYEAAFGRPFEYAHYSVPDHWED